MITIPTKADVVAAMQAALTAALSTKDPWGNDWATGVLGATSTAPRSDTR